MYLHLVAQTEENIFVLGFHFALPCLSVSVCALFPVQGMCADVSAAATHCALPMQRGEENHVLFCCLTACKGVPNEGPDCHRLRIK